VRAFLALADEEIRREFLDRARRYSGPALQRSHQALPARQGSRQASGLEVRDQAEDPENLADWSALHQEIEKLPVKQREVVSLVLYHGRTEARIAELFQVSVRTVQHWLQCARQELHRRLGGA
jgi:RNA polymerase sigma factor (sigma-70 family)